jgi:energy-coupling factor transport system ATP-binding protein
VGENGAGKSTMAKHLNGLLKPTLGSVKIGDWNTREYSPAQLARRVGYVFQNPGDQLFERTVWREVSFGPRNLGWDEEQIKDKTAAALAAVGLADEANANPYDLHDARRKLAAIAATLATQPDVIVLDEPTTGQDARGVDRIRAVIAQLKAEKRTVITISHDIDFCSENFARILVMSDGRILADGSTEDVLTETELLEQAAVDAPQLTRLALALGYRKAPATPEAFVDLYQAEKQRKTV